MANRNRRAQPFRPPATVEQLQALEAAVADMDARVSARLTLIEYVLSDVANSLYPDVPDEDTGSYDETDYPEDDEDRWEGEGGSVGPEVGVDEDVAAADLEAQRAAIRAGRAAERRAMRDDAARVLVDVDPNRDAAWEDAFAAANADGLEGDDPEPSGDPDIQVTGVPEEGEQIRPGRDAPRMDPDAPASDLVTRFARRAR